MSDDDISLGSVDELNDLSSKTYKPARNLNRGLSRRITMSSPADTDEDDATTDTSHTNPTSNIASESNPKNQSQAILYQAHLIDEQKKSAQVTKERKAFKAYKNTVLYMMKNLKRPEGMDDDKWYEAVERQAKAVIEAIDTDRGDEDDEGEEWYVAVEKRARVVIEEVGRRDVVGGDTEWGQGEWNDAVERKVKSKIDKKKKEELDKMLVEEEEHKKKRQKKLMEKKKIEEKKKTEQRKKAEKKKRSDEKYSMPNVPLMKNVRSKLCKLHTYPKFQHNVKKDAAALRRESQDENRSAMRQYRRTKWIMDMAEWKRRRAEWKREGRERCGCVDCMKDMEKEKSVCLTVQ